METPCLDYLGRTQAQNLLRSAIDAYARILAQIPQVQVDPDLLQSIRIEIRYWEDYIAINYRGLENPDLREPGLDEDKGDPSESWKDA